MLRDTVTVRVRVRVRVRVGVRVRIVQHKPACRAASRFCTVDE